MPRAPLPPLRLQDDECVKVQELLIYFPPEHLHIRKWPHSIIEFAEAVHKYVRRSYRRLEKFCQ